MKITQDLRVEAERMAGMEQKSKEFAEKGKEIYLPAAAAEYGHRRRGTPLRSAAASGDRAGTPHCRA